MTPLDTPNQIVMLGPMAVLLVTCNFLGYALKRSKLKNQLIPWVLMIFGAIVYPLVAEIRSDGPTVRSLVAYQALIGLMLGGLAVGLHQGISRFLEGTNKKAGE